jgi:hypothetical protein
MIYDYGKPRRNDIDREKSSLIHQSSLSILPLESSSITGGGIGE